MLYYSKFIFLILWLPLRIKLWYISLNILFSISWCLINQNSCFSCSDFLWTLSYWIFSVCVVLSLKHLQASASTRKAIVNEFSSTNSISPMVVNLIHFSPTCKHIKNTITVLDIFFQFIHWISFIFFREPSQTWKANF